MIVFLMILFILLFAAGGTIGALAEGKIISRKMEKNLSILLTCVTLSLGVWILIRFAFTEKLPFIIVYAYLGLGLIYTFVTIGIVKGWGKFKKYKKSKGNGDKMNLQKKYLERVKVWFKLLFLLPIAMSFSTIIIYFYILPVSFFPLILGLSVSVLFFIGIALLNLYYLDWKKLFAYLSFATAVWAVFQAILLNIWIGMVGFVGGIILAVIFSVVGVFLYCKSQNRV